MATIINNRSTIATDPLRNFRFLVRFIPQTTSITSTSTGTANDITSWAKKLGTATFGFTSVSGMAVSTESIPYREGGYNTTVHQIPGQTSFAPISMQRGVLLGSSQNYNWMRQLFQTVQGSTTRGLPENFRCDIEIDVLSHPVASTGKQSTAIGANQSNGTSANSVDAYDTGGTQEDHVAMRFKVYNAWISALAYSDLNAGDNAILVEQMSIVHEGFDIRWASDLVESAPDFTD
jgi:phage tail-like protein